MKNISSPQQQDKQEIKTTFITSNLQNPFKLDIGSVFVEKFMLVSKIGQGSFGTIYQIKNIETEVNYAAKFEPLKEGSQGSFLGREINILIDFKNCNGFPQIEYYGRENKINFCIMSLLGQNLENILQKCGRKFTKNTVSFIANQLLNRIQQLHAKGYIHRDLKADNFTIGFSDIREIYIIDFGLGKKYINKQGKHIEISENKGLVGTARYASINAHKGIQQSRRDDLESIGYILIYFSKGVLPWMNLKISTKKQKYEQIGNAKKNISINELCENLGQHFIEYFTYVKSLEFNQNPNYDKLRKLFQYDEQIDLDWESLQEFRHHKKVKIKQQQKNSNKKQGENDNNNSSRSSLGSASYILQLPQSKIDNFASQSIGTSNMIIYQPSSNVEECAIANDSLSQIPKGVTTVSLKEESPKLKKQPKMSQEVMIKRQNIVFQSDDEIEDEKNQVSQAITKMNSKVLQKRQIKSHVILKKLF